MTFINFTFSSYKLQLAQIHIENQCTKYLCENSTQSPTAFITIHVYPYIPVHIPVHTPIHPYVPLYIYPYIPLYLPVYTPIHLCGHIPVYTPIHPHRCIGVYTGIYSGLYPYAIRVFTGIYGYIQRYIPVCDTGIYGYIQRYIPVCDTGIYGYKRVYMGIPISHYKINQRRDTGGRRRDRETSVFPYRRTHWYASGGRGRGDCPLSIPTLSQRRAAHRCRADPPHMDRRRRSLLSTGYQTGRPAAPQQSCNVTTTEANSTQSTW